VRLVECRLVLEPGVHGVLEVEDAPRRRRHRLEEEGQRSEKEG
jgi:hypothetical protein